MGGRAYTNGSKSQLKQGDDRLPGLVDGCLARFPLPGLQHEVLQASVVVTCSPLAEVQLRHQTTQAWRFKQQGWSYKRLDEIADAIAKQLDVGDPRRNMLGTTPGKQPLRR